MKEKKLYNVLFPIWMIILFPPIIFFLIAGNFVIDSVVLLVALTILKLSRKMYKKTILKVWGFGFLGDIIGSAILIAIGCLPNDVIGNISWDPYSNVISTLLLIFAVLISGYFIYLFNKKWSFNNTKMTKKQKNDISIIIAVLTMPYMFLVPTNLLYRDNYMVPNYVEDVNVNTIANFLKSADGTILLGDNSAMINLFSESEKTVDSVFAKNTKELSYEIMGNLNTFIINAKMQENKKDISVESDIEKSALLVMLGSSNTKTVIFNIDDNTYTFTKEKVEEDYSISIDEIRIDQNISKLENILYSADTEVEYVGATIKQITKLDSSVVLDVSLDRTKNEEFAYITVDNSTVLENINSVDELNINDKVYVQLPAEIKEIYPLSETAVSLKK